ncbi:MAG: ribosomal L7Ae/L30e/S12e/Gadd45 family protein [bacterium]|nr:ribosomal L7Ae/L30e/S12e/Gadd45 family protein [bacterium]
MQNKILSMLGIAARGRNLVSGEFMTERTIKEHRAYVVLVAADASDNTRKMFRDMGAYHKVPVYIYGTKEELAHAIGQEMRASVAITDEGIAKSVMRELETGAKDGT